jgi:hypothetical protein
VPQFHSFKEKKHHAYKPMFARKKIHSSPSLLQPPHPAITVHLSQARRGLLLSQPAANQIDGEGTCIKKLQ